MARSTETLRNFLQNITLSLLRSTSFLICSSEN